jgi:hypothetical protein
VTLKKGRIFGIGNATRHTDMTRFSITTTTNGVVTFPYSLSHWVSPLAPPHEKEEKRPEMDQIYLPIIYLILVSGPVSQSCALARANRTWLWWWTWIVFGIARKPRPAFIIT